MAFLRRRARFYLTLAEIEEKAGLAAAKTFGDPSCRRLNPELPYDYYFKMLQSIRRILPQACLQAFTAVEIDYFTQITGYSLEQVLTDLKQAGLDSLPGGGAEVFAPRVRALICPNKLTGERWLEIHETAHSLGIRTNATLLYGHLETGRNGSPIS